MLALNNRNFTPLEMSQFFAEHGYDIELIQQVESVIKPSEPTKRAKRFVSRLRGAEELTQASTASAK